MKVPAHLIVTLWALLNIQTSETTFRRWNKNKGPFGGHLVSFGSTALNGFLRYAPDFYDVVPKIANKLLPKSKKHNNFYYDNDEHHNQGNSAFDGARRTVKRINLLLNKPYVGHVVPVHSVHNNYGFGYGGHDFGFEGYEHYPQSYSSFFHGALDELPIHGAFHDTFDVRNSLEHDFSSLHHLDDSYDL